MAAWLQSVVRAPLLMLSTGPSTAPQGSPGTPVPVKKIPAGCPPWSAAGPPAGLGLAWSWWTEHTSSHAVPAHPWDPGTHGQQRLRVPGWRPRASQSPVSTVQFPRLRPPLPLQCRGTGLCNGGSPAQATPGAPLLLRCRPSPALVLDVVREVGLTQQAWPPQEGRLVGRRPPHPTCSSAGDTNPQERQSSKESSRLRSTRGPYAVPATHLWPFGWGQLSPERWNVPRNVLPRLPLSGMPMATCLARARWDMLAGPGRAAASLPSPPQDSGGQRGPARRPLSPACLGFLLSGPPSGGGGGPSRSPWPCSGCFRLGLLEGTPALCLCVGAAGHG